MGGGLALHWPPDPDPDRALERQELEAGAKSQPLPAARDNELDGVAATSFRNAWAVGSGEAKSASAPRTLIEHWDGYSFAPGASRRPRVRMLIERWNGASWSLVPSPSPAGRDDNRLLAVSALSSSNAWAVGYSREPGARARPLIERWDGTAWKRVTGAGPGQKHVTLLGVSAVSARNAWAVGTYSSGGKPFDVGTGNRTLILHWNGTGWHRVGSPNQASKLGSNELTAVAAVSGTNAWSIGNHAGLGAETEPVAEHLRHGAWHLVATPMLR